MVKFRKIEKCPNDHSEAWDIACTGDHVYFRVVVEVVMRTIRNNNNPAPDKRTNNPERNMDNKIKIKFIIANKH